MKNISLITTFSAIATVGRARWIRAGGGGGGAMVGRRLGKRYNSSTQRYTFHTLEKGEGQASRKNKLEEPI